MQLPVRYEAHRGLSPSSSEFSVFHPGDELSCLVYPMHGGTFRRQMSEALARGETISCLDPKGDAHLGDEFDNMIRRGWLLQAELERRRVRFLPLQVMRPIYAHEGLSPGRVVKSRQSDFLLFPFASKPPVNGVEEHARTADT